MSRRKFLPPFEVEVTRLGPKGLGEGRGPDGSPVHVRFAPPGARLKVAVQGKRKGRWSARRIALVRPPAEFEVPPCPVFALCGGCALQELALGAQRRAKQARALEEVAEGLGVDVATLARRVRIHPVRGGARAYGYRNKVELSFGPRRFLAEDAHAAGQPIEGRFLGFHAPGRHDRVVDVVHCDLVGEGANRLLTAVRGLTLGPEAPAPYDPRTHTGFWRHLLLRHAAASGEHAVVLYTAPSRSHEEEAWVERVARALEAVDLPSGEQLVGVRWVENPGVADVARGATRWVRGRDTVREQLGSRHFRLSTDSFFQTNTEGAVVLVDTVGEALGDVGGTLLDLYCGTGAIGIYLADRFDRVVGVEEVEEAVRDAEANAALGGLTHAHFRAARVEEALDVLEVDGPLAVVVDPPRAGLHPRAARAIGALSADVLAHVACSPAALGRDGAVFEASGWRLTDLWTVDLFPQTGHVELVGRFERAGQGGGSGFGSATVVSGTLEEG